MECRKNLCNVKATFAATGFYQKINRSKKTKKITKKWCCSDDDALMFFPCSVIWISWALNRVFTCAMLFREYHHNIEHDFFMCNAVWSLLNNTAQGFYLWLCNVVPRELRQQGKEFFLVQCFMESQGQHYIGFFPCNVAPGVLRQRYTGFFLFYVVWSILGNTAQYFYLCNVFQEY